MATTTLFTKVESLSLHAILSIKRELLLLVSLTVHESRFTNQRESKSLRKEMEKDNRIGTIVRYEDKRIKKYITKNYILRKGLGGIAAASKPIYSA